ncbi:hypothetical protein GALL_161730 [mine drainage metagenome]|uniref:DUF4202 domain-containing protein n=1 Tax=mine drainage metagenome TaxID=410659 RepID=A0A1J5S0E7_9ZZZZ
MIAESEHYARAIALFDAANGEDPNTETEAGRQYPKELLYARRMSEMLERFAPDAPEAVRLAVRSQHIQRWKIPRKDYPMTPQGYQLWRTTLYRFHADTAGRLMKEAGYDDEMIERVQKVVGKRGLKVNPETQMMEDVVDLVFIEHYLTGFAAQHPEYDEAKWLDILRKTWKKMSPAGHEAALTKIKLPAHLVPLIQKAVGG